MRERSRLKADDVRAIGGVVELGGDEKPGTEGAGEETGRRGVLT